MNRKVSVAPMMDCTDKHERFFLRLISKNVLLYTEMIVSEAIDRGDRQKLLSFNLEELQNTTQQATPEPTENEPEEETSDVSLDEIKEDETQANEQEDTEATNS